MGQNTLLQKVNRRIWSELRERLKGKAYLLSYRSYWHYCFSKKKGQTTNPTCYFAARPNPGAGIGHQMSNWNAGYWFAKQFGLSFAHLPFSSDKWENFLGFGEKEITVKELLKKGYKKRELPLFHENNTEEINRTIDIMNTYAGKKVVFICTQDQYYRNQYGVMEAIQQKFHTAPARVNDHLIYNNNHFNIAIHVRRGDIMNNPTNPNLQQRYISNDYFKNVLDQVLAKTVSTKPKHIYFFSQGQPEDYTEFATYTNLHWCLDMGAQDSFLHMVFADCLITSKSSFSYKPALLNKNLKVCPDNFWHGYPPTDDWIIADENGNIRKRKQYETTS